MIIRRLALRQGRRALQSPVQRPWIRLQSTTIEDDISETESAIANNAKDIGSIESILNVLSSKFVSPLEAAKTEAENAAFSETYHAVKQLSKFPQKNTGHLGTSITPHYRPHDLVTSPPSPSDISLELLMASQAHLGHSTKLWNPANQRYIFGIRQGIHIIALDVTAAYLRRACKIVSAVTERGGLVLFVGTRRGQDRCVVKAARTARGCHLFERWVPGSITNGQQILNRCRMKVVDQFDREVEGYDDLLQDRAVLQPDLVVVLNPLENYILIQECKTNGIPTIGIVDTNTDPTWVTYPIPANDDSLRCVQVIAGVLGNAGGEGLKRRVESANAGKVLYPTDPTLQLSNKRKGEEEEDDDEEEEDED
ncbi:MAG: 37S ribosomal protein, mitochondrial [Piccolia ochrophora]|nr:MAG: 37S ribosomal protein, mitochondrial [Piccolia ochrophora]